MVLALLMLLSGPVGSTVVYAEESTANSLATPAETSIEATIAAAQPADKAAPNQQKRYQPKHVQFKSQPTLNQTIYTFNLPRQSVAASLSQFAQQVDLFLLFPHAVASDLKANAVVGKYTIQQGLDIMLKGTGFYGGLSEKGVLMISPVGSSSAYPNHNLGEGKMNRTAKKNILAGTIAFLIAGSQGVSAQDATSAEEQYLLDEIIVTATKRETNLQETGMSISVVSGKKLEELGIVNFTDVVSSLPSVTLIDSGPGDRRIILRGINATHQLLPGHSTTAGGGGYGFPFKSYCHILKTERCVILMTSSL